MPAFAADMSLHHRRIYGLSGGDRDERCAGLAQQVVTGAEHVEGAVEVDVDNSAKTVRRHAERRRDEITGSAGHNDIELTEFFDRLLQPAANGRVVAHIA